MKKTLSIIIVAAAFTSCGNGQSTETGHTTTTSNPSIIEDTSTQHPNGVTSDRAISTDTAAFGVNANRADSTKK